MTTEETGTPEEQAVDLLLKEAGGENIVGLIHKADENFPAAATFSSPHGYITVYDQRNGDPSLINRYMLTPMLKKKDANGKRIFWTSPPADLPPRPMGLNCMLHRNDPNREEYDKLGLPICIRVNLANPYEVLKHMQSRHKTAWGAIQEENRRKEKEGERRDKDADRKFQRELLGKTIKEK